MFHRRCLFIVTLAATVALAACSDDDPAAPSGGGGGNTSPVKADTFSVRVVGPTVTSRVTKGYFGSDTDVGALVLGESGFLVVDLVTGKESPTTGFVSSRPATASA